MLSGLVNVKSMPIVKGWVNIMKSVTTVNQSNKSKN